MFAYLRLNLLVFSLVALWAYQARTRPLGRLPGPLPGYQVFLDWVWVDRVDKKRLNFVSQWEQKKVLTQYFLFLHVLTLLSKKAEFLFTMRAIKRFDTILFVSSCLQIVKKKDEFLITMRAIKSFDTTLFVSWWCSNFRNFCHKKGRVSYSNESNQKFWLSLMKRYEKLVATW